MIITDDDEPLLDYEGKGLVRSRGHWPDKNNDKQFNFHLFITPVADSGRLNLNEENDILKFEGNIIRTGEDGISLSGKLSTQISGKIQFVKMKSNDYDPENAFPEIEFQPGDTVISFKGKITGRYIKEPDKI